MSINTIECVPWVYRSSNQECGLLAYGGLIDWSFAGHYSAFVNYKVPEVFYNYPIYIYIIYVTLSHLRSKEFQRILKPCIPHHRDTSQCTPVYIEMYPGHFKRPSHYHQSKDCLDVEASILLILYRPRSKLIVGLSFILVAKFDCGIEYQHEAVI